jgi:cysteine-rich repeat protein
MDNTDACVGDCSAAACGDGFVQQGVEACDDGNVNNNDGCSSTCMPELRPNLLRCGTSTRNVADFIPMGVMLNVVASCAPDNNTQAILITRNGLGMFNAAALKAYVEAGGIVLTEVFVSDEVYNAVFLTAVPQGGGLLGGCTDVIPTVFQFNAMDPFWQDNMFNMIALGASGCGNNVAAYPNLTALTGWSANQVSVGYRNAGAGRVWVTEFDWQDNNTVGVGYDYTEALMGYMITTGQ